MAAYRAGKSAYETGDYKDATTAFRWAAGLDPDNPIYSHAAALSAARAGADDLAGQLFIRAVAAIRQTLGVSHPFMLIVTRDFSRYCRNTGVAGMNGAAFAQQVVAWGDIHAVARSGDRTLQALKELCAYAGRAGDAVPFFEMALKYRRDKYGRDHAKTRFCINVLTRPCSNRAGDIGADGETGTIMGRAGEAV
jgi:predicted Zn-dependent protease